MEKIEQGMLAWSRAGHDKGILYLVCDVKEHYVFLADGKSKTMENPKKKNRKHIQIMKKVPCELEGWDKKTILNEEIRKILKKYSKSSEF